MSSPLLAHDTGHVDAALNPAKLQGSGKLYYWGFHIYDAALYRSGKFGSPEFALDIIYYKSFSGLAIADRTVHEMKKIGIPERDAVAWGNELSKFLPNIEPGHSLTAIYKPESGTTFFHNGKRIALIPDAEFSKAFFGVWLDQNTRVPKLRTDLLGSGCSPLLSNKTC